QDLRRLLPGAERQQPGVPGHRPRPGADQEAGRTPRRDDRLRERARRGDRLYRGVPAPARPQQAEPGPRRRRQSLEPGPGPDGPGGQWLRRGHRLERPGGPGESSAPPARSNTDGYAAPRRWWISGYPPV